CPFANEARKRARNGTQRPTRVTRSENRGDNEDSVGESLCSERESAYALITPRNHRIDKWNSSVWHGIFNSWSCAFRRARLKAELQLNSNSAFLLKLHVQAQPANLVGQHVKAGGRAGFERVLALDHRFVDLGAPLHVVGLDGEQLLEDVG